MKYEINNIKFDVVDFDKNFQIKLKNVPIFKLEDHGFVH